MNFWNNFAAKHPAAAKWVREGGLFVIVSNLITVFKYLLLQFLPKAFASLPVVDFGWPGIDITLFGETFKWNILGYDAAHGGLPYFHGGWGRDQVGMVLDAATDWAELGELLTESYCVLAPATLVAQVRSRPHGPDGEPS